ncbi:helix-turn-helix transcriptional regulator [Acetobacter sp.]|uniref:helix-turn-helix transcriptional regulator n=1 Tax=Acetobacter sp. TaxID=440 RepID=UPI0039E804F5
MRHEKAVGLIRLARQMAGSAEGLSLNDMARIMRVSRRTADRLRVALAELFPQMEEITDGRSIRFRISGGLDGFLQTPTVDELAELHTAVTTLANRGSNVRADLLASLQDKVRAALRPSMRARMAPDLSALTFAEGHAFQAGPRPITDPILLETIRMALKAACTVRFFYANARGRIRTVTPWGLLYDSACYLVGPEMGKTEPALWRLDRMQAIEISDNHAHPAPECWNIEDFISQSFGVYHEPPRDIVLCFSSTSAPQAAHYIFHPTQTHEVLSDGSLVVRFQAGGLREIAYHLFTWGTAVQILSPAELRTELHELLRSAADHHERSPEMMSAFR